MRVFKSLGLVGVWVSTGNFLGNVKSLGVAEVLGGLVGGILRVFGVVLVGGGWKC